MALVKETETTGGQLVAADPDLATTLLNEALELIASGEPAPARLLIRDVVNGLVGFEVLATKTEIAGDRLQEMLSPDGTTTFQELSQIFVAVRTYVDRVILNEAIRQFETSDVISSAS